MAAARGLSRGGPRYVLTVVPSSCSQRRVCADVGRPRCNNVHHRAVATRVHFSLYRFVCLQVSVPGVDSSGAARHVAGNGTRFCITRAVPVPTVALGLRERSSAATSAATKVVVDIVDCFGASAKAANAVEWTTSVSSAASELFSVQLGRGLTFAAGSAAPDGEEVWTASDAVGENQNGAFTSLLDTASQGSLPNTPQWLGGYLTTSGLHQSTGAYQFSGPRISVPAVMLANTSSDSVRPRH